MARLRNREGINHDRLRDAFDYSHGVLEEVKNCSLDPVFIKEAVHFLGKREVRKDPQLRSIIFYVKPIGRHRLLSNLLNVDNPSDPDNFQSLLSHNEVQEKLEELRNGEKRAIWPRLCLNNIARLIGDLSDRGPEFLAHELPALMNPTKETLLDRGNEAVVKWDTWNNTLLDAEKIGIAYEINKAKIALEEVGVIFWEFQRACDAISAFLPGLRDVLQRVIDKLAFAYTDNDDEEINRPHYAGVASWHMIKISPLKVLDEGWIANNLQITDRHVSRSLFKGFLSRQDEESFSENIVLSGYEIIKNVRNMQHEILHALASELLDRRGNRELNKNHEKQEYPNVSLMKVFLEGISVSFDFQFYNQLSQNNQSSPEILDFVKLREKNTMRSMAKQRMEFRGSKDMKLQDNKENAYFLGFSWALAIEKNGWDVTDLSYIVEVFKRACSEVLGQKVTAEMLERIPADLEPNSLFARCISMTNEMLGKRT